MINFILKLYVYLISKKIYFLKNLNYHFNCKKIIAKKGFLWYRDKNSYEWTQTFAKYINNEKYINNFLNGLDTESLELGKVMIEKIKNITFHNVLEYKKIITLNELKEQEDFSKKYFNLIKKYHFPTNEISSYLNLFYIPKLTDIIPGIENYLENKDVIDAGAYIGDSGISFSNNFKNIKNIYCFEPVKSNFEKLKYFIKKHSINNVIGINKGVGEKNEILKISSGGAGSKISSEGSESIEIIKIDDFVIENKINVGLIKWDIEGFEYESILGALQTIQDQKPILLISIYHRGKDFFETKTLIEDLNLGYKFKLTRWNCFHPLADLLLVCY